MNKSESKYFNTAARMDAALLTLLEKKEFAYITVKEICAEAGVNRSTFYLHYETIGDLLNESITRLNEHFLACMQPEAGLFMASLSERPVEELFLITPDYLNPYLCYIRTHKRLFKTALKNASTLQMEASYRALFQHVFTPILDRYHVPESQRHYLMAFYIHGLMAIITEWLKGDCTDSIESVSSLMQQCVKSPI